MATEEGVEASLAEVRAAVRGRVALEEGKRDLAVETAEDRCGAGPVLCEQRGELVGRGHARRDVVVAQPDEGLQLAGRLVERPQRSQPVAVGAQQIGEPIGVTNVGLTAGALPPWPGCMERVRVDRDNLVPCLEQPVDEQPVGPLDRDRQLARAAELRQLLHGAGDTTLAVYESEPLDDRTLLVDDAQLVRLARPIDSNEHLLTSLIGDTSLGAEGPSRLLTRWPSTRLTPNAGRGPSARSGRRDSCRLSKSTPYWPSPSGRQEHHRTLTSGSDGMVQE